MSMHAQNQYLATIRRRPSLLTWLRRRPHPDHLDRTFHQLDPTTGRWHRL